MYAWIWRHLPGPWPAKVVIASLIAVAVVAVLFVVVFPWLEPRLPFTNVTVDDEPGASLGVVLALPGDRPDVRMGA